MTIEAQWHECERESRADPTPETATSIPESIFNGVSVLLRIHTPTKNVSEGGAPDEIACLDFQARVIR